LKELGARDARKGILLKVAGVEARMTSDVKEELKELNLGQKIKNLRQGQKFPYSRWRKNRPFPASLVPD